MQKYYVYNSWGDLLKCFNTKQEAMRWLADCEYETLLIQEDSIVVFREGK